MDKKDILQKNKNITGEYLIQETKLKYSKEIIRELNNNSERLKELLNDLDINEAQFFNSLINDHSINITYYDYTLKYLKRKK